jgi:hypothetical protein
MPQSASGFVFDYRLWTEDLTTTDAPAFRVVGGSAPMTRRDDAVFVDDKTGTANASRLDALPIDVGLIDTIGIGDAAVMIGQQRKWQMVLILNLPALRPYPGWLPESRHFCRRYVVTIPIGAGLRGAAGRIGGG